MLDVRFEDGNIVPLGGNVGVNSEVVKGKAVRGPHPILQRMLSHPHCER
jgi:hypothetical protein